MLVCDYTLQDQLAVFLSSALWWVKFINMFSVLGNLWLSPCSWSCGSSSWSSSTWCSSYNIWASGQLTFVVQKVFSSWYLEILVIALFQVRVKGCDILFNIIGPEWQKVIVSNLITIYIYLSGIIFHFYMPSALGWC